MSHFDYKPFYYHIYSRQEQLSSSHSTWRVHCHNVYWSSEKSHLLKLQNDSRSVASKRIAFGQKREHCEWRRQWFQKFEKTLDHAQNGPLWLKDERVAKEVRVYVTAMGKVSLRCLLHHGESCSYRVCSTSNRTLWNKYC